MATPDVPYVLYLEVVTAIRHHLQDGVHSWEFGTHADKPRRRTWPEVEQMLTEVIEKLENDDPTLAWVLRGFD